MVQPTDDGLDVGRVQVAEGADELRGTDHLELGKTPGRAEVLGQEGSRRQTRVLVLLCFPQGEQVHRASVAGHAQQGGVVIEVDAADD